MMEPEAGKWSSRRRTGPAVRTSLPTPTSTYALPTFSRLARKPKWTMGRNSSLARGTLLTMWITMGTLLLLLMFTISTEASPTDASTFLSSEGMLTTAVTTKNGNRIPKHRNVHNNGQHAPLLDQHAPVSHDPCCSNETQENVYGWHSLNGSSPSEDNHLYDVPVYLVVLLSLAYGFISFTAVIGNLLVLWVVLVRITFFLSLIFIFHTISF